MAGQRIAAFHATWGDGRPSSRSGFRKNASPEPPARRRGRGSARRARGRRPSSPRRRLDAAQESVAAPGPSVRSRDVAYSGTAAHSRASSGVTSRWNCTPYAAPKRKAWFAYAVEPARRTAPSGRSNVSPCHWSVRSPSGSSAKTRPSTLLGELDRQQADFRLGALIDARAEARSEQLHAEADTPERRSRADDVCDVALLRGEPRVRSLVVHAHRPTHRDHRIEVPPLRKRLALVELDPMDRGSAVDEDVLVRGRWLARDVLQHEDVETGVGLQSDTCSSRAAQSRCPTEVGHR